LVWVIPLIVKMGSLQVCLGYTINSQDG
jgi:hypothetical protein